MVIKRQGQTYGVCTFADSTDDFHHLSNAKRAWDILKGLIISAPVLEYPDFTKPFILYVDGSKEWGYGASVHQIGADDIEHPVVFLSRLLHAAEKNYWATELECRALVWALTKLPHFFDSQFHMKAFLKILGFHVLTHVMAPAPNLSPSISRLRYGGLCLAG